MQRGSAVVANLEDESTNARVYAFEASLGVWRGLSARAIFPILDVSWDKGEQSGREAAIGDMSLMGRYDYGPAGKPWRVALTAGAYLPTGSGAGASAIPANPNFISGTVDPVLGVDGSYELDFGLGFYVQSFARLVLYRDDGYQAGHSLVYGGGARYRLFRSLLPSLGVTVLHRARDDGPLGPAVNSGGDWLYLTPGLSYMFVRGPLAGLGLYAVGQIPLYQNLNGMQLAEDFSISFGLSFGRKLWGGS